MITPDSIKLDSNKLFDNLGIAINEHLPLLEDISELSPQPAAEVATRAVLLQQLIGVGFGAEPSKLITNIRSWNLSDSLSDNEKNILSPEDVSDQVKIDCQWLIECMQSFAFCLGLADLNPLHECDDDLSDKFPSPHVDPSSFISQAKLIPFDDIYRQADIHYRLHWAARQAQLTNQDFPIAESVIRERRRALDWVIGVEDDWDEVPSDT